MSKIIESLRGDLAALHEAGAISKVTMREFDAICPPPVREFNAADIKRLREALKFSQPVFALHLHTSASTVRKWEQGETHPTGPALKLLKVENNGIRERVESTDAVRAKPGEKSAGAIERTVRVIANVVAVNPKAGTVTLRGPKRTVELVVNDPAQLKEIKVGNQVEAEYVEAVALEVTAAKKK